MRRAPLFDMDGLLIDSEPLWFEAVTKSFKPLGIKPTKKDWENHQGQGLSSTVGYYYHKHKIREPTAEELEESVMSHVFKLVGKQGKLQPGVIKTLDIIKQAGLPMAIASSSTHDFIGTVVDVLGIRDYFSEIHSAHEESFGKPHPGVFISTAVKLGVEPQNCLVFEDAPSGVLAAKSAKMHCIAVPDPAYKKNKFIQTADLVLDSLEEFSLETLTSFA